MGEKIGRFDVSGTERELRMAADAIGRCNYDFARLRGNVTVRFKPPSAMPPVPGTTKPALAFCRSKQRRLLIRTGLGGKRTRSVLIHEIGHMVDADTLNRGKRVKLMSLMEAPDTVWSPVEYRKRPSETFAESFVRAFSDVESTLTSFYALRVRKAKLGKYRDILLSGATAPDEEVEFKAEIEPDDLADVDEDPDGRLPVNIVDRQLGTIAKGTPFFHPATGAKLTSADPGGDFRLVGVTSDGQFRFAVVETRRLVPDQKVRALLLVRTTDVTDIRVEAG